MARTRNIKPGFFLNEEMAELEPLAQLLFIGMWCLADRAGRLLDKPKRIKAQVFPYRNCDIEPLLESLAKAGFISRYKADGMACIEVVNFAKHQAIHPKETPSTLPAAAFHGSTVASREKVGMDANLGRKASNLDQQQIDIEVVQEGIEVQAVQAGREGKGRRVAGSTLPPEFDPEQCCISGGRYALRDYPFIYLRPNELTELREEWRSDGLSDGDWVGGLKRANVELERRQNHRDFKGGMACSYLRGFIRTDAIKLAKEREARARAERGNFPVRLSNQERIAQDKQRVFDQYRSKEKAEDPEIVDVTPKKEVIK